MCTGGQDIPVTLRVAGGVEGGKWKSSEDVRATPSPEEEVQTTETTETTEVPEPVGPSTPLYQPVIDRINKLSEKLPDEVADETVQEMQPMMHHGWGMNDKNHANTMQMLDRIMRNTRPRRPRVRDHVFGGGRGKGGGRGDPRKLNELVNPIRPQQTLGPQRGATQGLAGAGLGGLFKNFGGPSREQFYSQLGQPQVLPLPPNLQFAKQPTQQPMQPEVIEEQEQQMEILGQPKQFAGWRSTDPELFNQGGVVKAQGGIVNALMATPIGQSAIREYANGGEIKFGDYDFNYGLTGDSMEDILHGIIYGKGTEKERPARFFGSQAWLDDPSQPVVDWGRKEEEEKETPTLKRIKKILKPPKEEHQDSTHDEGPGVDPVTGVTVGHLSEIDYDPQHFQDPEPLGPLGKALAYGVLPGGSLLAAADPNFKVKDVWDAMFGPPPPAPPTYSYNYGADPGLVAAASGAFGHTPEAQISRSEIYGEEEAPALSQQQVQDLQSQVDSFSEIAGDDFDTGYSGQEEDAEAPGDDDVGMGTGVF